MLCCWYTVTDVLGGKDGADDEAVAAFTTPLVMISLILLTAPERDEGKELFMHLEFKKKKKKEAQGTTEQGKGCCTDCQRAVGSVLGHANTEVYPWTEKRKMWSTVHISSPFQPLNG